MAMGLEAFLTTHLVVKKYQELSCLLEIIINKIAMKVTLPTRTMMVMVLVLMNWWDAVEFTIRMIAMTTN